MFKFLVCFLPIACAAQNIIPLEFSISQIDSLSKHESFYQIYDYGKLIRSEKEYASDKTKIIGVGGGSWKINAYFNDKSNYERLTKIEKRRYDNKNTCRLVRADYSALVNYDDGSSEKEKVFFYFNDGKPFFVKYSRTDKIKFEHVTCFSFFFSKIDQELAGNVLLKKQILDLADDHLRCGKGDNSA